MLTFTKQEPNGTHVSELVPNGLNRTLLSSVKICVKRIESNQSKPLDATLMLLIAVRLIFLNHYWILNLIKEFPLEVNPVVITQIQSNPVTCDPLLHISLLHTNSHYLTWHRILFRLAFGHNSGPESSQMCCLAAMPSSLVLSERHRMINLWLVAFRSLRLW